MVGGVCIILSFCCHFAQCIEVYNLTVILENIYRRICVFVCCGVIIIVQFNVISFFVF